MTTIKSDAQIAGMRRAGHLLHGVMGRIRDEIRVGVSTAAVNACAEEMIRQAGATPSFLNYRGYPASICVSIDSEVVHGIPSPEVYFREGSLVSVDCGLILDGWHADSAFTLGVGEIRPELQRLIQVTEACFFSAARAAVEGNRIGDIGHAVQRLAEQHGYGVIRALTGHGIGRELHEDPSVPNVGEPGRGLRLRRGMTLAVEPMISLGAWQVFEKEDGWTVVTRDRSPCSHYEHTIAITEGLPEILTLPGYSFAPQDGSGADAGA